MVRKIKRRTSEKEAVQLTPAQQREKAAVYKWEDSRKMGKIKYILVKGTLSWSLMTTAIFVVLTLITTKFFVDKEVLLYFLKMFVVFLSMGTLFGIVSWHFSEKKYQIYMSDNKDGNSVK